MSDVAHLVDEVLPEVPIRQWVCRLPWRLRTALAYDRRLCADVLDTFVTALTQPLDFIARLAALVPARRFHMQRYHGVLAANAKARAEVVPQKPIKKGVQLPLFMPSEDGYLAPPPEPSRHPWPWLWLLKRVFAVDISVCPRCTGRMRVIEVAKDEDAAARVLSELGISARAPPPKAASRRFDPRQLSLSFAGRRLSNRGSESMDSSVSNLDHDARMLGFMPSTRLFARRLNKKSWLRSWLRPRSSTVAATWVPNSQFGCLCARKSLEEEEVMNGG